MDRINGKGVAIVAVLLAVVATLTLGGANATLVGALILGLVVVAGAGIGLSVASPRTHR